MKLLEWILWTVYGFKFLIIFSWLAHSVYLMRFPQNLNVLWNLFSSIFLLILDVYGHAIYCYRFKFSQKLLIYLCAIFLFLVGPVLLGLSLFGSLTDSINYDQEFCRRGCALSIFFRDFHSVLLYIVSIFGIGAGILFIVFICCLKQRLENILGMSPKRSTQKYRTQSSLYDPLVIEGLFDKPLEKLQLNVKRSLSR